jgi:PAS domain S-box-containing protein
MIGAMDAKRQLSSVSPRQLRALLLVGLACANFFVLALAGYSLHQGKQQNELRARVEARNLSEALSRNVANSIDKIDLVLQAVTDELERQLAAAGRIDEQQMNALFVREMQRLPELEAIRVADADGTVFLGKGVNKTARASWADREYFVYLRAHADGGLQISKPRIGRVAQQYIVGFARRYNHPDGSFAGVVSAPVALDHFKSLLARFDAGPNGTLVLRDGDLGLVARQPPIPADRPAGTVGNNEVSQELRAAFDSGRATGEYFTQRGADGFARLVSFQRLPNAPLVAIAGMARDDYLADWHNAVVKTAVLVACFVLLSLLSAGFLLHLLNRVLRESARNERYLRHASDGIHVLDAQGNLVEANDRFCAMLGYARDELLGQNIRQWDAGATEDSMRAAFAAMIEQGRTVTLERRHRRKDGALIDVDVNAAAFVLDGKPYIHASSRDIGERKRSEESERHQKAIFKRLNEIAALSHLPLAEQLKRTLVIGTEHFGLEFGIVSHVEGDSYEVVAQVSPGDALHDGQRFPFGVTYCSITLAQDGVVAIPEMGCSPYLGHPCYSAFKLESYIGAPIRVEEKVFGTVNFSSPHPYGRAFDDFDQEFVAQLARWAGSAIERDHAQRRIAASELELKTIVENEPECVKLLSPDGLLLQMNRAGLDMIEADTAEQVVGHPIVEVVAPEHRAAFTALNERVCQGATGSLEFEVVGLKGGRRWLETHAVPMRDDTGRIVSLLSVTRDISARKEGEAALLQAKQAAEAANMAKSQFLATMSHEIRTPMNGIIGMAQLLLLSGLNEEERLEYARTIFSSGHALLAILNDILDLSKIDAGRMELTPAAFDPRQLIDETAALFAEMAHSKPLILETAWHGPDGQRYWGDPIRLRQMLSNLLSNALKFTERGAVRIEAREESAGDAVTGLRFVVSDTGIGIPADELEKLFQPFSQVDASATRRYGGTGLGLSIVRRLANLMGGDVAVESRVGAGSAFSFHIRAQRVQPGEESRSIGRDATQAQLPPVVSPAAVVRRILVAEDNKTNRVVIESLLRKFGYEFLAVEDGQAAVDAVMQDSWRPDLVLMDCQMPNLNGFDATTRIRAWEAERGLPRLPIVALTASAFQDDRDHCLAVGMDDFLAKPVDMNLLQATLLKWFARAESAAA